MTSSTARHGGDPNESTTIDSFDPGVPEFDDPVVLRESLRQAHDQLRLYASFDQVIAANVARSEALLAEASRQRQRPGPAIADPEISATIETLRQQLTNALASLDELERRIVPASDSATPSAPATTGDRPAVTDAPSSASDTPQESNRTDILIHNITSPALARSAQAHLAAQPGIVRADVRELAEGLLRITVEGTPPVDSGALANWTPDRKRNVITERLGVVEIELGEEHR